MSNIQLRAPSQVSNLMSFFVILLCVSQVYASCSMTIDDSCATSFPTQTVIGIAVGAIILVALGVLIRVIRRRRSHQRSALPAYSPSRARTVWGGIPSNTDGRPRSNIPLAQTQCSASQRSSRLISTQMNAVTQPPPFPQSPRSSARTNPASIRPPSMPSPSYRPLSNHTPGALPSSPDSFNSRGRLPQPSPPSFLPHSVPARVSANLSSVETPSAVVTPTPSHPSYSSGVTSIAHQLPVGNMEPHRSGAMNDEPPPAYTPI